MKFILAALALIFWSNIAIAGTCTGEASAFIGVLEFDITECEVTGKLENKKGILSGKFEVDLAKLETGLSLRDEHMRDKYLEVSKYPKAKFTLNPTPLTDQFFSGELELHGVKKQIGGKVLRSTPTSLETEFVLDLTQYGIKIPEYKGITIAKSIRIRVKI